MDEVSPNFLKDPNVGPIAKQQKKKKVGAHSLTHNTLGVGEHVRAMGWDYNKLIGKSSRWSQPA